MPDTGKIYFITLTAVGILTKCPLNKLPLSQLQLENLHGSGTKMQNVVN